MKRVILCGLCSKNKSERLIEKCEESMEKEFDIVRLIKMLREIKQVLKHNDLWNKHSKTLARVNTKAVFNVTDSQLDDDKVIELQKINSISHEPLVEPLSNYASAD